MAKLDPDNAKTAKAVMEEKSRKRKREEQEDFSEVESFGPEDPTQHSEYAGMQVKKQKRDRKKKRKSDHSTSKQRDSGEDEDNEANAGETKQFKSQIEKKKKRLRMATNDAKAVEKLAKKAQQDLKPALEQGPKTDGPSEVNDDPRTGDIDYTDIGNILDKADNYSPSASTVTPSPNPQSPIFDDLPVNSGSSTISSIAPSGNADTVKPEKLADEAVAPKPSPEELKARLMQRIEFLRAARKADGLNGKPARNRQELIEARRQKEEQRKAHKRELRRKEREEEREKQKLLIARGSPLLLPPGSNSKVFRPSSPPNNFSFNRIAFGDGQNASAELSTILPPPKPKGPQDPLTALQAAQKKQTRLDALDPSTRADIAEKDLWLNARKRAHGEQVRDDTSLLKKTLKRKEQAKKKSEREWGERIEGVEKGKAMRVKRREENLRKRKEDKGGKKGGKKTGKPKPKGRPGFEGSLKARAITGGKRIRK